MVVFYKSHTQGEIAEVELEMILPKIKFFHSLRFVDFRDEEKVRSRWFYLYSNQQAGKR